MQSRLRRPILSPIVCPSAAPVSARAPRGAIGLIAAALLAMGAPGPEAAARAMAQPANKAPSQTPVPASSAETPVDEAAAPKTEAVDEEQIEFEAREIIYDRENDLVIARGNVLLRSRERSVFAQEVRWDRKAGLVTARGTVRMVDGQGNVLYTQDAELSDAFDTGAMGELLVALRAGGRLAARSAERGEDGVVVLRDAAYSACALVDPASCAKDPSWRITAQKVLYDPAQKRIRFRGAVLELFGARLLPLPGLTLRSDGRAISGLLVPDLRISRSNGLEVSQEYYLRLADNQDLALGASVYTGAAPMASVKWRHLTAAGAYQITGYVTNSRRISSFTAQPTSERDWRGYVFTNGRFQLDPNWSVTASIRRASDRTFLRRYDLSRDDRLRSTVNLERIDERSYLSIAGWSTQTLRLAANQDAIPVALPAIDYRLRLDDPIGEGTIDLQANSLAILRRNGQDTQRAFASAQWSKQMLTPLGQTVKLTALARGDLYHSDENQLTATAIYRGNPGWQTRAIALGALDVEWPFIGEGFGGTQTLTPRLQLVATPRLRNLAVPNEDSRAIDLEDTNLFSLNRFPGYDRFEDGVRLTYGFDWELYRPGWRVKTSLGQSYRFSRQAAILPDGTGLSERVSDVVGRTEVRFRDFVKFTHRFRLDKDNLAVRRNEIDATFGSTRSYVELGYVRLNRDITTQEDLQDREELRAAGRAGFARYWSVFGSGVFNLTDRNEDPTLTSDGFEPIRTRLGVAYDDGTMEFGLTWRRDYVTAGDARRGDTFQVFFSFKNLGFR